MNLSNIARSLLLGAFLLLTAWPVGALGQQRYRVAACDWMMLKRQKLGEFQLARDIGADGIEMDMGALGRRTLFDNKLREPHFRDLFRRTADSLGIAVPSMAMSGFFAQNLLTRDNYRTLAADCLQSMQVMGATVAFLPLGGSGSAWQQEGSAEHREMVSRLRDIGRMAMAADKVVAIRTGLDARANIKLLKEIGSEGIKIYYNLQDAVDNGRDACKELQQLGRRRVAQIHASLTDSVTLDRDPRIDLRRVRRTLDRMHWQGWLVVERSRDAKDVHNVKGNYGRNVKFLKEVFRERPDKR